MPKDNPHKLANVDMIDMGENEDIEGEFIRTEVKDDKMIKRNSVDNYKNDSAGVRETLANSVAAIMEAESEGYLQEDEGEINVNLEYEDQRWKLIIRDNGIGMTRDRLEVVSNMGDSTSSAYEDRIGKYGIGFFAIFLLVEISGAFLLATKSRKTGNAYLTRWRLRGAKITHQGESVPQFKEDEYGTQIELYLKEDLSPDDVDKWIRTHAFASRRKVIYTKEDRTGNSTTDIFPNVDITEEYDSINGSFSVESDWFTAITSPNAKSDRFLLDISVPQEYTFDKLPWPVSIRFHTEEKTVVSTNEHSVLDDTIPEDSLVGMSVLPSDQYDMLPKDMKDKYIPKRDLPKGAVYTPSTAGTRDSLSEVTPFMNWLQNTFQKKFRDTIDPILDKEIPKEATEEELLFLYNVIGDCNSSHDVRRTLDNLTNKNLWSSSVQNELSSLVEHQIKVEGTTFDNLDEELSTSYSYGSKKYSAMGLHKFAEENDGVIYMGVNINENKSKVARRINDNVIFVKLSEAAEYDIYEPLGWNKLKNINKSFIQELNIDEKTEEEYIDILTKDEDDDNESVYDKSITIRFGVGRSRNLSSLSISELVNKLKNSKSIGSYTPEKIILFPDDKPENVSDYYTIGGYNTGVAKASRELVDHLKTYDKVQTYNEYYNDSLSVSVPTTKGYLTGQELLELDPDVVINTIIGTEAYNMLSSEKLNNDIIAQTYYKIYKRVGRTLTSTDTTSIHLTLTPEREKQIRPVLQELSGEKSILYGTSIGTSTQAPDWHTEEGWVRNIDTAKWVMMIKVNSSDTEDKDRLRRFISNGSFNISYGGKEFIETFTDGL